MKYILALFLNFIILAYSFQVASAQVKTYTNKDIDSLKKNSQVLRYKKKPPKPVKNKIPGLPVEKKEIITQEAPIVKYKPSSNGMTLTVIGKRPPAVKTKQTTNDQPDLSLPSYLDIKETFLPREEWKNEYEEYFDVHYASPDLELVSPKVIAIRSLKAPSFQDVYFLYKHGTLYDEGDDGLLYNHLSSHFVIDSNGIIYQTMPLNVKTKGAFGVEHSALTVELTGISADGFEVNSAQKQSLETLLTVLVKKFKISPDKIYSTTEIASGKQRVPEYLDNGDSDYPDRYSPAKSTFGPPVTYMDNIRKKIKLAISTAPSSRNKKELKK